MSSGLPVLKGEQMNDTQEWLSVKADQIISGSGRPIILKGVGIGGWMNMENFVSGFPATEEAFRQAVREALGKNLYERFFDAYLRNFFDSADAEFIRSLGLNSIRIALNYRHFEDDMRPFEIKENGFVHLDRIIQLCVQHKIYAILDLHALPGYQNQDWHSDNPTHKAFFWTHKHFQDRVVNLWQAIAERYKVNPWVAGYNLINEPADPSGKVLIPFYGRLIDAIRGIDPDHIIFLDGNRYSMDFGMFGDPFPNVVYGVHDYPWPGFAGGGPYPGITQGEFFDKGRIEASFVERCDYMLTHKLPIWVGEFGPVYGGDRHLVQMRLALLQDQLDIYGKYQASWSLWTYKDIGLQGIVYIDPHSGWMKRIEPVLQLKNRLGVDAWGGVEENVHEVMDPLKTLFEQNFPDYAPFPFGARWQINRLVRHILFSEPILEKTKTTLAGLDAIEIQNLMRGFQFQNCVLRTDLCEVLHQNLKS